MGDVCSSVEDEPQELLAVDTAEAVLPLLHQETFSVSVKALREAFDQCDTNKDNFVTRIELIKACRSHPTIAHLLGLPEHLRESAREQFEHVFQAMDSDSDSKLTFDEMKKYFVRAGVLLQPDDSEDPDTFALSKVLSPKTC